METDLARALVPSHPHMGPCGPQQNYSGIQGRLPKGQNLNLVFMRCNKTASWSVAQDETWTQDITDTSQHLNLFDLEFWIFILDDFNKFHPEKKAGLLLKI